MPDWVRFGCTRFGRAELAMHADCRHKRGMSVHMPPVETSPPPIAFAGSPIDRVDELRTDAIALGRLLTGDARVLQLSGSDVSVGNDSQLVWAPLEEGDCLDNLLFLGMLEGRACFVRAVTGPIEGGFFATPNLWQAMSVLEPGQLAIFGGARSLVLWHATHGHCARCGGETRIAKGGWSRTCNSCAAEHFPRVDPVTITVVERDRDFVLLGRQPRFPAGLYSTLAGFVEPGETLEESVRREIHEESGVSVEKVQYIASQPWPFPSTLMVGCKAVTRDKELKIDYAELEDARWFSRDEVRAALNKEPGAPMEMPARTAIAGYLLRQWLDGRI